MISKMIELQDLVTHNNQPKQVNVKRLIEENLFEV